MGCSQPKALLPLGSLDFVPALPGARRRASSEDRPRSRRRTSSEESAGSDLSPPPSGPRGSCTSSDSFETRASSSSSPCSRWRASSLERAVRKARSVRQSMPALRSSRQEPAEGLPAPAAPDISGGNILGRLVQSIIDMYDADTLGVKVQIEGMECHPMRGRIEAEALIIPNLTGYRAPYLLHADKVVMELDMQKLLLSKLGYVEILNLTCERLDFIYETTWRGSNLKDLLAKLYEEPPEDEKAKEAEANATKVTLRRVDARNVGAKYGFGAFSGKGVRVKVGDLSFEDFENQAGLMHVLRKLLANLVQRTLVAIVGERALRNMGVAAAGLRAGVSTSTTLISNGANGLAQAGSALAQAGGSSPSGLRRKFQKTAGGALDGLSGAATGVYGGLSGAATGALVGLSGVAPSLPPASKAMMSGPVTAAGSVTGAATRGLTGVVRGAARGVSSALPLVGLDGPSALRPKLLGSLSEAAQGLGGAARGLAGALPLPSIPGAAALGGLPGAAAQGLGRAARGLPGALRGAVQQTTGVATGVVAALQPGLLGVVSVLEGATVAVGGAAVVVGNAATALGGATIAIGGAAAAAMKRVLAFRRQPVADSEGFTAVAEELSCYSCLSGFIALCSPAASGGSPAASGGSPAASGADRKR